MNIDENGMVVNVSFLLFENINAPSAPGPFLWITRRTNERHHQVLHEDIYIAFRNSNGDERPLVSLKEIVQRET